MQKFEMEYENKKYELISYFQTSNHVYRSFYHLRSEDENLYLGYNHGSRYYKVLTEEEYNKAHFTFIKKKIRIIYTKGE